MNQMYEGNAGRVFSFGAAQAASLAVAAVCLFLGLFSCPPLYAIGRNYEVRQIAPHTFVWIPDDIMDQSGDPYFNRAVNVGFIITPAGVVVLDTANNPFHAREVLYEIRQRTELPVRLVIDMGPQGDQMLGNEVFAEQHATIVSTSAAEAGMQDYDQELSKRLSFDSELFTRMRGIHFTLPGQTFHGQTSFNIGGTEIRLAAFNCGLPGTHAGDAVAYVPQEKVLFLGDLYVHGFVPQIGPRNVSRWISVLGQVEKWDVMTYVPGHGNPGTHADVATFRGFLEWLNAGVEAGVRQGKTLQDVEQQLLSSSAFNLLGLDLAPRTIAAVYHQIVNARSAHVAPPPGALPLRVPEGRDNAVPPANSAQGFRSLPAAPLTHP
ncbi:MAG: MBL fold metallo-hydrolase [Terriglobia bacterium]